jgi:hypothetical protein
MRYTIFDVHRGLDGEWPEPLAKTRINKQGADHRIQGAITAFGDAVLVGGVGDGFFISDTRGFADCL